MVHGKNQGNCMYRQSACLSSAALILIFGACDRPQRQIDNTVLRDGNPGVTNVEDDNPTMQAAFVKAKESVGEFIQVLAQPPSDAFGFAVKMKVTDGDKTEYIWLSQVSYADDQFRGVLGNEPLNVKTVRIGETLAVPKQEIVDWMYIRGNTLVGGYTTRAVRELMTPAERVEFDRQVPFKME
jgi:uncharacterized protein YegJ (DUF2314 family)